MPPRGTHLAPRAYPHYRAGLTPGHGGIVLTHMLPDGQLVRIQTTQPYEFAVIAHEDLAHKYALACRRSLREGYKDDYRRSGREVRGAITMRAYVQSREEAAYLRAYATPPESSWALLRWSRTAEAAALRVSQGGGDRAIFWEPINNGVRTSAWPIASMARLPEPYPLPDTLRFGYQPSEKDGTDE